MHITQQDNIDLKSRPYEMALLCYSSEGQEIHITLHQAVLAAIH